MSEQEQRDNTRTMISRIVAGVLWFIPIYLAINILAGSLVQLLAGGDANPDGGYAVGQDPVLHFFDKYGPLLFVAQVLITAGLSIAGILPGTGKWKRGR